MAGCNQPASPTQPLASSASAPAPAQTSAGAQQAAYTPPTADQLYQMVAPIALFPDKLVAQVLAGSTYPDQITAADGVLAQNPDLKGDALQTAIVQQPWDPSVKGLTVFPSVLDQMAKNIDWTTSLGEAYVNDPTDVMNAIQVMRQRASSHGSLRSSAQQSVQTQAATPVDYATDGSQPIYSVVPAPSQVIEIQPSIPDTVYVPQYNPQVVYGGDVPYYPGYTYEQPSDYSGGDLIVAGAIGFGAAILIGSIFDHHHDRGYGWNNWGMNWGGRGGGYGGGGYGDGGPPAVVYNNNTYVSRSTTVINRNVTNNNYNRSVTNINDNRNVGNTINNRNAGNSVINNRPGAGPIGVMENGRPNGLGPHALPTAPNFGANAAQRGLLQQPGAHGIAGNPGIARPAIAGAPRGPMSMPHFNDVPQRGLLHQPGARGIAGNPGIARPAIAGAPRGPMSMPHFNGVPQRGMTTAQSERFMGRAAPNNLAPSNVASMQHGLANAPQNHVPMNRANAPQNYVPMNQANAPQNRVPMNHANGPTQLPMAQARGAGFAPQQHVNPAATQQQAFPRPVMAQHFNQPQHLNQPQRQAPPQAAAPREMAAPPRQMPQPQPRPPQPQPMEPQRQQVAHQPSAPQPQPQVHSGGGNPPAPHPAQGRRDDKHR